MKTRRSPPTHPKTPFTGRLWGLRAARYFYTTHPGVVQEADLIEGVGLLLAQSDIADIPIEYLRQWKCWKLTRPILALWGREGFGEPIIRRAIVRYALQCPDAKAAQLVAQLRQAEDALLSSVEEELKLLSAPTSESR